MKKKNKGITLIALIITIIVLLILAGITILALTGENGILNNAQIAENKNTKAQAKEKLKLVLMELQSDKVANEEYNEQEYIDNKLKQNDMQVDGDIVTVDGWKFKINRSLLTLEEYEEENEDNNNDNNEDDNDEQIPVGQVVSSQDIYYSPEIYYGKEVLYSTKKDVNLASIENVNFASNIDEQLENDGIKWRIFYSDLNHIYLIASDYVKVDGDNYYKVFDTAEETLSFMTTQSNWEDYVGNYAEYAIGGPTFTMFCDSWNAKYPNNMISGFTGNEENGWSGDYDFTIEDDLYFSLDEEVQVDYGCWLASKSANETRYLMHVDRYSLGGFGFVYDPMYGGEEQNLRRLGFRPIICLKSDINLQFSSEGFVIYSTDDSLASQVQVGDYVAYNALAYDENENPYSYISQEGTGAEHGNGYGQQTFTTNSNIRWVVLNKNMSTGQIVLISENPIMRDNDGAPFYMKGAIGYLYAEEELNRICSIYGHGEGADTSKVFNCYTGDTIEGVDTVTLSGSAARSINADDVNEITNFDKTNNSLDENDTIINYAGNYGTTYTHTVNYPTKNTLDGISTSAMTRTDTANSYGYYVLDYLGTEHPIYNESDSGYWLASRSVNAGNNGVYDWITFNVGNIGKRSQYDPRIFVNMDWALCYKQQNFGSEELQYGVRPIVYLKPTLEANGKDADGAWIIEE